ncbi:sulfotransferase [Mycobacterium paragordonae]|uniref:Sulfotransferase n=1 Tax=Mycobacterium paragordonae TaxID=1389713 RepID=A0ABQ1C115_9MYCO|nr:MULTISPECIES: sulfotransferase [Mycobacterium]AYE94825.1 sulfotransferase [Mycobacterium paragordonae]OBJ88412.1 hypothetical protein A9W97_01310 [Mycobacterium gordonae]GFG77919.1 putative sulfotransferase [Mycobacterium paragordonae]
MTAWKPPQRTRAAEELYRLAETDRAARPARYQLGIGAVELVIGRASRQHSPDEFGDQQEWLPALNEYLCSAEEDGQLNALGARSVQNTAVGRLRARAAIAHYVNEHSAVAESTLQPPIFIIGGWRTGTTYLFRALSRDPRLRAPLPAELGMPWQFPGDLSPEDRNKLLQASAEGHQILHILNPIMAAVHDSGPSLAEECVLGMGTTMRNWGFLATTRLNNYAKWLRTQSFAVEYAQHRRMLQILDGRDGRRWLLKAPAHTAELDHLIATYPGACVVHLHRDIVETVASGASLFATYRSTYSDHVNGLDIGQFQTEQTELWFRRALAVRNSAAAQSVTWLDLQYTELLADPHGALAQVYRAAGMNLPDIARMLREHHRHQPREGKGKHTYNAAQFGIDAGELRERMRFYVDAFSVSS